MNINEDGIEILKLDLLRENNDDRVKTSLTVFYETDDELQLNANITKNVRLNYLYLLLRQKVVGNETVKWSIHFLSTSSSKFKSRLI